MLDLQVDHAMWDVLETLDCGTHLEELFTEVYVFGGAVLVLVLSV